MSLQQVNLYQEELKKQKLKYSAVMMLQLISVLIVIMSVVSGIKYWQLNQQQKSRVTFQQKQKIAMAELQKTQQELSVRQKDIKLVRRLAEKTKELTNKQKVLGILNQDKFGNTKGFVPHISGLARQKIDGLWLTRLKIAEGGVNVELHGTTSKPSLLPKYLQRLSAEKIFSGTEFTDMLIARQEKKTSWLDFSLKNNKTTRITEVINP